MASENEDDNKVTVGNVTGISGEVNIAGRDIYNGYTAEQVSVLLKQITFAFQPKPFDGRCPYKGLDVFEEDDVELFFGRERLVEDLISRVKESRAVFITGPSGTGKSSLVRAGLLPALKQGAIKELHSERWCYETLKPGRDPMAELARVASSIADTLTAGEDVRAKGFEDKTILTQWCEIGLKDSSRKRAVIFIDQFEEIFTQISKEQERRAFLDLLTYAATVENGRVILLFAMRSDFISSCATYPPLNQLLNQQFMQVGAMRPDELVSAIAQPALRVGLRTEPDLIAQIINDMESEPGALPLMQFALKSLFDAQQDNGGVILLTLDGYHRQGGIHKALERHADNSFSKLTESEQELTRSLFSGLIEIGHGTQDTRRTALFDELIPTNTKAEDVRIIVQKLADARLIITDERAGRETVTISHEKLIDAWPWLKKLVNENRDVIALQNEIADDAEEWEDNKRDSSYLYTGMRLINVREQLSAKKLILREAANEFIQAGLLKQKKEQRGRILVVAGAVVLLIAGAVLFSFLSTTNANKLAEQSKNFGNTQAALASTSDANAVIARTSERRAQEQANIALARQLAAEAKSIYSMGNSMQEVTVLLSALSIQIFPTIESAQILQTNTLAYPIANMSYDNGIRSISFSPNDKYVVLGSYDGTARVWEAGTGKEVARMSHGGAVYSVSFSSDGRYLVSGSEDQTARVWEAATGREVARMTHGGAVYSVAFSPDGKYVLSGSGDHTARVWEAATGKEVARMTHDGEVYSVAFSPDGRYVVSGSEDNTVRTWEAETGKEVARMTHDEGVYSVAFSPDSKYVVSGGCDAIGSNRFCTTGSARIWDANTGTEVARMIHKTVVSTVAFSSDGKYVASGSYDDTACVWEAATGKKVACMSHNDGVLAVVFSPDGKYIASFSYDDNTAHVWEAQTGKEVTRVTHNSFVYSIAFSPDGRYVISGSDDNTVRVWEIKTGKEIARMAHNDSVLAVAFGPDSKYVVSGSWDGTANVWLYKTEDLIKAACDRVTRNLTRAEWKRYIGDALPYKAVCENYTIEP
jgi:WD40 repeat protein